MWTWYKFVILLGFLALLIGQIESANILGVFTSSSPSHQIVHVSYAKALAERGHNVTVVTTIPLKDKNPKYLHILITPSDAANKIIDAMKAKASEKPGGLIDSAKTALDNLLALGSIQADSLKDERFQDFMNNPDNKFDLLIVGYFLNDFHVGLGAHFKCPVVLSWAGAPLDMLNRYVGNPAEIAYVQAINVYGASDPTKFTGRLKNFFIFLMSKLMETIMNFQMKYLYE
ncbi:UDP-glucosyltransferase 2-like [Episyrphus balteatus]|uniref:UDP-glucosyltransferase 2-like n=1 Tax=Episyrphus balteatus TaxID=286459 RepID=UPI002485836B|nr:UDP-glucosyltransferase 2-like [Episyrphus balteatus]